MTITSIKIANAMVEQLRAELAAERSKNRETYMAGWRMYDAEKQITEQLRAELAAAQAVIEQMREALHGLVKNDGVDAFYHLDKGIGTATVSGKCWLSAREALTLQPCPEILNKVRADAVREAAEDIEFGPITCVRAKIVDRLNTFAQRIEQGEA